MRLLQSLINCECGQDETACCWLQEEDLAPLYIHGQLVEQVLSRYLGSIVGVCYRMCRTRLVGHLKLCVAQYFMTEIFLYPPRGWCMGH